MVLEAAPEAPGADDAAELDWLDCEPEFEQAASAMQQATDSAMRAWFKRFSPFGKLEAQLGQRRT